MMSLTFWPATYGREASLLHVGPESVGVASLQARGKTSCA